MKIKLCGIRRFEDISYVNEFKPDYIGFVFAQSKRQISADFAAKLKAKLDGGIKTVGIFVNSSLKETAHTAEKAGLDVIQLHGDENESFISSLRNITDCEIWKAVRIRTAEDIINGESMDADKLLLDSYSPESYGGTGKRADLDIIKKANIKTTFFLAGGLNKDNIISALRCVSPFGADISGGIETNGFKDKNKIKEIINLVRSADFE